MYEQKYNLLQLFCSEPISTKLKFANYMVNTANGLLAAIFRKLTSEARPKIWVRQVTEYLGELGQDFSDVGRRQTTLEGK